MALVESQVRTYIDEIQQTNEDGQVLARKKVKIKKRLYPCRPQVNQRKKWDKFGEVSHLKRGINNPGDCFINSDPINFKNDEGQLQEELEIVTKLRNISKQSMMIKQLRNK